MWYTKRRRDRSWPPPGAIADYVVEAVERHGRLVLLCSHCSQAVRQSSYIELLSSGTIDGMMYLGSFRENQRLATAIGLAGIRAALGQPGGLAGRRDVTEGSA
jgi:DNA-binding LacI/PurR family transcriptional regulator